MEQNRFDELILNAAGENGLDPCLVKAVIWRETKFNPQIRGKSGEYGLMQVMPETAKEWAKTNKRDLVDLNELLDPATNLRVGTWYLSKALQDWDQASEPIPLALAQYNAGRSHVLKWADANALADGEYFIRCIRFPSTRSYVKDIVKQYQYYRKRGEF